MRYLSVCSGIEAASVAWHHLGWEPVGFSEIEPFPAAVLAHRFPNVPNYGDMTKFQEWPIEPRTIDVLVGGTPCQSFSVAGLRKGLEDPRGNLMLTYLAIAARLKPRWLVWENVPGVLSSNGGRDFGTFLGALGQLGYGWCYRCLDAQHVRVGRWPRAVPQRRRRVFVVGCFGNGTAAAEVLALREGLQRHLEASGKARKSTAPDAEGGARGGCWWDGSDCAGTLTKQNAGGGQRMPDKDNPGAVLQPTAYRWQNDALGLQQDDAVAALRASAGSSGFHEMNHPVVLARDNAAHAAVAFQACGDRDNPSISVSDTAFCLPANAMSDRGQAVAFDWQKGNDVNNPRPSTMNVAVEHSQTIGTTRTPAVAVESLQQQGYDDGHASTQEADAVATLRVLRDEIGAEAFTAWGLGVLDSLQPSQVLRARLHGEGIRCASFSRSWPIDCAISRPEDRAAWAVQSVQEAKGEGCSPSRRELPQQLAEQLGAYLSQLPCPGPQDERLMHHLWCASKGVGILRQALSEIQEARRPVDASRPTSGNTMTVRRLTATECEFLQGFPRNWTLIPWRGKPAEQCPDGPRYKALGNSMACNCMAWIGERIAAWEAAR